MTGTSKQVRPFGAWPSAISARSVAGQSLKFGSINADRGTLYWSESRPDEGGRSALMGWRSNQDPVDLLPPPYSVRSRVHEYGGGAFLAADGEIYFINDQDQDVYRLTPGQAPERLTSEPGLRFADMCLDRSRSRLIAVGERHAAANDHAHPENLLVQISLDKQTLGHVRDLVTGHDFFASPTVSPDGEKLAYMAWDLPDMPWDSAALYLGTFDETGALPSSDCIAGGAEGAVFQPEWSGDGTLLFVSDKSGWGNFYRYGDGALRQLTKTEVEFSQPLWNLGIRYYVLLDSGLIAAVYVEDGYYRLGCIDPTSGTIAPVDTDLRHFLSIATDGRDLFAIGATDMSPLAVFRISLESGHATALRQSAKSTYAAGILSKPEVLNIQNAAGQTVFGLYYPPASDIYQGPDGDTPPVILSVHGGPTASVNRGLNLKVQYWTSRGFALFAIDYSGSTGYGRAYRERLDGNWGKRDVEDCVQGAQFLAATGRADPKRLLISGGSAGGYTVLAALAASDLFAAGACYYGISDLLQLHKLTHKFEAGYLYRLLGISPDDGEAVFRERSPLYHVGKMTRPVILFQGVEDKVVPPDQAREIVKALRAQNVPVFYLEFPGEGHGFRKADTIEAALNHEYAFYVHILNLDVREPLPDLGLEMI